MAKQDVKNLSGANVGSIDLDDAVFGVEIHEHLLWEVVKWQLAKRRAGTASTKRFGEVRGTTKKIWKQKGTGQARHGSRQAPNFVGGGSVFGPKPRSYEYNMPRKAKKLALCSALSLRAKENKLVIVDEFNTDGKTKSVASALSALNTATPSSRKRSDGALIVDGKGNVNLVRGARNLAVSQWIAPEGLNVYDILRHGTIVMTKAAVEQITAALKPQGNE